jgi:hypothetical protein
MPNPLVQQLSEMAVMFQFSADLTITRSLIEVEEAAEPPTTSHTSCHLAHRWAEDEETADTLVIPFGVVVLDVLRHGAPSFLQGHSIPSRASSRHSGGKGC